MSLPDIVATAFALYTRFWRVFLGLGLLVGIFYVIDLVLLQLLADGLGVKNLTDTSGNAASTPSGRQFIVLIAFVLSSMLVNLLGEALIVPAAFEAFLGRRPTATGIALAFRSSVLVVAAVWVIAAVAIGIAGLLAGLIPPVVIVLFPLGVWALVHWSFVIQAIVRDGGSPILALRVSWRLVKGAWWRVARSQAAILLLGFLPGLAVQPLANISSSAAVNYALIGVGAWLAVPFTAIARTVLYADIKLRKGEQLGSSPAVISG